MQPNQASGSLNDREHHVNLYVNAMAKKNLQIKLEYDVCGKCGVLFDDQGENGWWIEKGVWWHECNDHQPARIVVRKLARVA